MSPMFPQGTQEHCSVPPLKDLQVLRECRGCVWCFRWCVTNSKPSTNVHAFPFPTPWIWLLPRARIPDSRPNRIFSEIDSSQPPLDCQYCEKRDQVLFTLHLWCTRLCLACEIVLNTFCWVNDPSKVTHSILDLPVLLKKWAEICLPITCIHWFLSCLI